MALIAAYDLDESAGASRVDATGNGHTLTDHATVGQGTGLVLVGGTPVNHAATFNGSTQYLTRAGNLVPSTCATPTLVCLVNLSSIASDRTLVGEWLTSHLRYILQYIQSSGQFQFVSVSSATAHIVAVGSSLVTGTTYCLQVGIDPARGVWIRLDGGSRVLTAGSLASDTVADFYVGANQDGGPQQFLAGSLDSLFVFDQPLTDPTLDLIRNSGNGIQATVAASVVTEWAGNLTFSNVLDYGETVLFSPVGRLIVAQSNPATTYNIDTPTGTPTTSLSGGILSVAYNAATFKKFFATTSAPTVPCFASGLTMSSLGSASGGDTQIGVGLVQDANTALWVEYVTDHTVHLYARQAGTTHQLASFPYGPPTGTGTIWMTFVNNEVSAWGVDNTGTTYLGTASCLAYFDLTDPAVLAALRYGFVVGYQGAGPSTIQVSGHQGGLFGHVRSREHFPIRVFTAAAATNNQPYTTGGNTFYMLVDAISPTSQTSLGSIRTDCYQAIWKVDVTNPNSPTVVQTGAIFVNRGGHIYNDQDGRAFWMLHDSNPRWGVVINEWGTVDTGVAVDSLWYEVTGDLLHGLTILSGTPTTLRFTSNAGGTTSSNYDVDFWYDLANTRFLSVNAYTDARTDWTNFGLNLDHVTDIKTGTFVNLDRAATSTKHEGGTFFRSGGILGIISTKSPTQNALYDLQAFTLNEIGSMQLTLVGTGGNLNPHTNCVSFPKAGGGTYVYALSFDNTIFQLQNAAQGHLRIDRATQEPLANEYTWTDFTVGPYPFYLTTSLNGGFTALGV